MRPEARAILAAAPAPAAAAALTTAQLKSLLKKAGRRRGMTPRPPGCAPPSTPGR